MILQSETRDAPLGVPRSTAMGRDAIGVVRLVPTCAADQTAPSRGIVDQAPATCAPEARLVFSLAAGAAPSDSSLTDGSPFDWTRALRIAWDEGATHALRDHVRGLPTGVVPRDVERQLACLALEREMRMRMLQQRTAESVAALATAGIDAALLKGAALAMTVYGSFAARPMKDVDILVAPRVADEAKRLLLGVGWAPDPELPGDDVYATHHHLAPLIDRLGSRSRLEIHRELLPSGHPFHLAISDLWDDRHAVRVGGERAFVLDPNQHALHITIHFAWSHAMTSGGWNAFRDLHAMSRAGMIDWQRLVGLARAARAGTCCYWTLALAQSMSGLAVPAGVLESLAPPISTAIRMRLERHFVQVLLREDAALSSVRLARSLWATAIQPERQGHRRARPWLASPGLTAVRLQRGPLPSAERNDSLPGRVAACAGYLARLLWS